jgi:hypothetical protein
MLKGTVVPLLFLNIKATEKETSRYLYFLKTNASLQNISTLSLSTFILTRKFTLTADRIAHIQKYKSVQYIRYIILYQSNAEVLYTTSDTFLERINNRLEVVISTCSKGLSESEVRSFREILVAVSQELLSRARSYCRLFEEWKLGLAKRQ